MVAEKLKELGYREVNLNLGCPSGTVTAKKKGSGFLAYPDELDRFLEEIFEKRSLDISIKTRIGADDPEEFEDLLRIFNRYPVRRLIVHPRVQKDFIKISPGQTALRWRFGRAKPSFAITATCFAGRTCIRSWSVSRKTTV